MDVQRYWHDFREKVSDRISFLASDLRFIWVVKDKSGLYLVLAAIGLLAGVSLFTAYMLEKIMSRFGVSR